MIKKVNDKKNPEIMTSPSVPLKSKVQRKATEKSGKISTDKEIKLEDEVILSTEESGKGIATGTTTTTTTTSAVKQGTNEKKGKKISDSNLVNTPKSGMRGGGKSMCTYIQVGGKGKSTSTSFGKGTPQGKAPGHMTTGINLVNASPKLHNKKSHWSQNISAGSILSNFENYLNSITKENLQYSFTKLNSLQQCEFYNHLLKMKKDMNEMINFINNSQNETTCKLDYQCVLYRYIENCVNQINSKIKINVNNNEVSSMDENIKFNLNTSTISEDGRINYINTKENSVAFEIPVKHKRAMSTRLEKRLISCQNRPSSEEIERRIKEKLETVEKNKTNLKLQHQENLTRITLKINEIKMKKRQEKHEKIERLYKKLEKMNTKQQQIISDKVLKAKNEQDKVAEINLLHRLDKENRDLNIIRKLDISIERRNKYLAQRLNKTIQRNLKDEASRKNLEQVLKQTLMKKFDNATSTRHELAYCKKKSIEDRIEFLKSIFSENFIWELLEADYFDIDELCNLTNITKFELMKSKLKKDKEIIDKLFKKGSVSVCNPTISSNTYITHTDNNSNTNTCSDQDFRQSPTNADEKFEYTDSEKGSPENIKRSKSFTIFDENDFLEVDYLFKENLGKKKKKKKKIKKKPEMILHVKQKLLKTINSLSQTELASFFTKMKMTSDKKIKRLLLRSKKNGRYIQSRILISSEEILPINEAEQVTSGVTITGPSSYDERECNEIVGEQQEIEDKKEKIFQTLIQSADILKNDSSANNTILVNSESLSNILEKKAITVRWCKLCNLILPNDMDTSTHVNRPEHKKLKGEYGVSLQDDSNLIMVFQSLPGDISEELRNERINAIKLRVKKIKQRLSLRAVKHENFWTYKQDFPSVNKQRIQKISFDVEKQIFPNIKDYDVLESNLKELIKLLEQKKQNDLHILRQVKIVHCMVEVLKKPAVCHKSEIKSLGKILELIIKILMYFSTLIENRNYMVVTNRISVIADLLLWVLNKPSKIPLGISFLPDLIYIITIHIKHRIPFEYLSMKDDSLEYLFISNILIKFKQKYTSLVGPIDLTSGFGSFPLVLLKSLGMIEALTSQININYCSKPVYVRHNKISENILFILEHTELVGMIHLLSVLLLSNGPVKSKSEKENNNNLKSNVLPQTVLSASLIAIKIVNSICRLDLTMVQNVLNFTLLQEQMYHVFCYIINYCLEYLETADDVKELLHETILLMNYIALLNEKLQIIFSLGETTLVQRICALPFSYFCDKKLKDILFPTLIALTYNNGRNSEIMSKEVNLDMIVVYLKEKIQLEPIIEEEEMEKFEESSSRDGNNNLSVVKINKEQFMTNSKETVINGLKKRTMSFSSTASSTKSCHDMIAGVSDFVLLYHRFPHNLWEKALEYYSKFEKNK